MNLSELLEKQLNKKYMNNTNCGLSDTPKKISQIEEQLMYCDKARNQLSDVIGLLSERLSPVLRSQNPSTVGESAKEQELTIIAEAIKKNGREMEFFASRIRDIIDRLEI